MQISFVISLLASLVLLGWWATVNIAMLPNIALHPQMLPTEPRYPRISQVYESPPRYLFFNGDNSYGSLPASSILNVNQFSIAFWVRSDGPPHQSFDRPIEMLEWKKNSTGVPIAYGWAFDAGNIAKVGNNKLRFTVGNNLGNLSTTLPVTIPSTTWTHIVGTFDGTRLKLYQNGVLGSASPKFAGLYSRPITPMPIQLAHGWLPKHYWTGDLSDIRIYNRAVSTQEVRTIFQGNTISSGLIGHWKLDEGSGNKILDSSGYGNNGIIHNATWKISSSAISANATTSTTAAMP